MANKKVERPFTPEPVIIDWVDSMAASGWMPEHEGVQADMRCCTIGHKVNSDKQGVTVALNRSAYNHGDYIKIPHCAIRSIRKLR